MTGFLDMGWDGNPTIDAIAHIPSKTAPLGLETQALAITISMRHMFSATSSCPRFHFINLLRHLSDHP